MSELTIPTLKSSFKTQNLTEKDHLNYDELYIVISKLNSSPFDEETYEQIWDQCKLNSKGEVRISDFMDYLIKAEELLIEKQNENAYNISKKQNAMKGKIVDFTEQKAYNDEMDELRAQRQAVKNSLNIIRRPFVVQPESILQQLLPINFQEIHQQEKKIRQDDVVNQLFEYDNAETPTTLANIFYVTSFLMLLTWIASFFICQFLNLIVYTCILSQFSFHIISKKLIKFNLLLLCYCTIFDILWLILQTDKIWYLPSNFQLASMTSSYLKFSIILMIFCLCLRVVLMYYYLSQFHIDEFQVYIVRLLGRDLNIQREAQPLNPNKHALSHFLQPYFNKSLSQDEQIQ